MGTVDVYQITDRLDDATLEVLVTRLESRGKQMRQMPQLLREAGLELTASFAYVVAEIGKADFWASAIQSFLRLLPKSGAMTQNDAQEWADTMVKRSDQGVFFGASNYYSYVATRC